MVYLPVHILMAEVTGLNPRRIFRFNKSFSYPGTWKWKCKLECSRLSSVFTS